MTSVVTSEPRPSTDAAPKWRDSAVTASGEARAVVPLSSPTTLWFNTGTLCNIACLNCYIESSPENDRLVYISHQETAAFLNEAAERGWPLEEVGLTGGEPFMNPEIIAIIEEGLRRGLRVLVLTNAMRPMMRPRIRAGLLNLRERYGAKLIIRVSLDHFDREKHDAERGGGTYDVTLEGMRWLSANGFVMHVAGRTMWGESEVDSRAGFAALFARENFDIDAKNPAEAVLFPEMDMSVDPPEITTACWDILGKRPDSVMCASSRMVVKRRGADRPSVIACTLLPYEPEFDLGSTLAEAEKPVALNHPHCSKFCVLGGANCSG